jgi:hypothetical protein
MLFRYFVVADYSTLYKWLDGGKERLQITNNSGKVRDRGKVLITSIRKSVSGCGINFISSFGGACVEIKS